MASRFLPDGPYGVHRGPARGSQGEERLLNTEKAAPRAAFAKCQRDESAGRRMSGPPPVLDRDLDLLRRHAPTLADDPGT
ncbi:2-keto-3-deoxy-D-arabino-heptulosonate-7-phosphate synthase II (EC [Streptomyces globisporus]|uniref:2-keto-3-deoxy-D-arabino-heptulosonate-7-phosphate synthase II (EC) n=1 Tax=Streptomyces globisporus TaxID=1908 RepID=A0ABN8UXU1_STRGL|nr:2-keto-3-deoxy-D-arabino-heptulosonate-7-phosphate synthase II (EC [Streptomyces globisporus]